MGSKQAKTTSTSSSTSSSGTGQRDNKGRQSTRSSSTERRQPLNEREKFRISCLKNARYHEDRELYFARVHKFAMFTVVVAGTASFAPIMNSFAASVVITLAALLDLVFDVSGKARLHASLRRRVYDVLAQTEDEKRKLAVLKEQAIRIYADEPPTMHAVNALAFNGAMLAFDRALDDQIKLNWYQRFFRHMWSFGSTEFKTYGELGEAPVNP